MADKKRFNKAAFMREMLAKNPDVNWAEVKEAFTKAGQTVTQAQFYQVRGAAQGGTKKKTTRNTRRSKNHPRNPALAGAPKIKNTVCPMDSVNHVLAATKAVQQARSELFEITGCLTEAKKLVQQIAGSLDS